jgi:hypothetical protein
MTSTLWFWAAVTIAVIYGWIILAKRQIKTFDRVVATVNREHGLSFPKDPLLGSTSGGLLFDRIHRKILFIGGSKFEILDYSYIVRWSFRWDISSLGGRKKLRIFIETKDFNRPQMNFPVLSMNAGELWVTRLDVLLNQE